MTDWKNRARTIPNPENYFRGRSISAGFRLPGSILLYFHDYPHEKTIISTRYMLILPTVPLEYQVAGSPVPLAPGEALLVHPFLQRSVPERSRRCDRLIVSFEAEGDEDYLPPDPVMQLTETASLHVSHLVDRYLAEDTLGALFELVLLLRELGRSPAGRKLPSLSPPVSRVLHRINQEPVQPVSIKELADFSGLSASHLRWLFRQEMGISLGEYLTKQRLTGARRLLEESSLPVGEIARRCGYGSIYAFSRFFRREAGMSPRAYRLSERRSRRSASGSEASRLQ